MSPRLRLATLACTALWAASPALGQAPAGQEGPGPNFLPEPPTNPVHHHVNRITIDAEAVRTGWADLYQCHTNMDALGATQIVFREGRIRNIEVLSTTNIEQTRVEGPSVQLDGVQRGAEICLRAETRNVERGDDGTVTVRNGPFMRRLFDSYFPMHVTLTIHYPADRLRFRSLKPAPQPGLSLERGAGRVTVEAWFSGTLRTRLRFDVINLRAAGVSPIGDG